MQDSSDPKRKTWSAFRSAAEEADMKREQQTRDDEGGHMSSTSGRVIQNPGAELPYVVVLTHQGRKDTEHSFATMREAEAFIKRNTPVPCASLSSLYDRPASDS